MQLIPDVLEILNNYNLNITTDHELVIISSPVLNISNNLASRRKNRIDFWFFKL